MAKRKPKNGVPKRNGVKRPIRKIAGILLLKFRAAMGQYGKAHAESALLQTKLEVESIKPEHAYLLQLQNSYMEATQAENAKGASLQTVVAQVAKKIGVPISDMQNYVVDDETGTATYVPPLAVKVTKKSQATQ